MLRAFHSKRYKYLRGMEHECQTFGVIKTGAAGSAGYLQRLIPGASELLHEFAVVRYVIVRTRQLLLKLAHIQQVVDIHETGQLAQDRNVLGHVEGL